MIVTPVTLVTAKKPYIVCIVIRDSVVYSWCVLVYVVGNKCNKCNIHSNNTLTTLNTPILFNSLGELR